MKEKTEKKITEEASAIHTVWILWSCIYHEFKDILEEK